MEKFSAIDTKKNVLHNNIVWERHIKVNRSVLLIFNLILKRNQKFHTENILKTLHNHLMKKKEENQDSFKIMYENEIWRTTGNKSGSMIRNFQTNVVFRTQRILYRTEGKKK